MLLVERFYTHQGESPYTGIPFTSRDSQISKLDGTVVFKATGVTVPESWDQTETDILAQKYFRRKGCDFSHEGSVYNHPLAQAMRVGDPDFVNEAMHRGAGRLPVGAENDLRETIHRIVGCWAHWGEKLGYFDQESAQAFYDELSYMMATQKFAPNSPQWFNTGLNFAYGITGPAQGHFYTEDGVTRQSEDAYTHPATSACFILSVSDDLTGKGGITDLWTREARIFKMGGGAGENVSAIRGAKEPLSGGGTSSGLMSFLAVNDRAAGAIKSGGTTRRAARIVVLDIDHPDIEDFIAWKVVEERKAAAITMGNRAMKDTWEALLCCTQDGSDVRPIIRAAAKQGVPVPFLDQCLRRLAQGDTDMDMKDITLDWEGEAYQTVSAQNSNNSVRVTDAFMEAVLDDGTWDLTRRTDGSVVKTVRARELWDKIASAAWMCADPGLQFDDRYNDWHTGLTSGRINATNPCSEFAYLDDTACNLASINLCAFLNEDGLFDSEGYEHTCKLVTMALEITVAFSQFPSEEMAKNSYEHRPLGLGYANLGSLLMRLGLPYDSKDGRDIAAALSSLMTARAYATSSWMAAELGTYPAYGVNREHVHRVLGNHRSAATNTPLRFTGLNPKVYIHTLADLQHPLARAIGETSRSLWESVCISAGLVGLRNAQVTVLAPTGTIGIIMGCDTTGIEPDFALVKFKKLAGGGYLKMVNGAVPQALKALGYGQTRIDDILDYIQGEPIMKGHTAGITRRDLNAAGYNDEVLQGWDAAVRSAFDPAYVLPVAELVTKFGQERVDAFLLDVGGRSTIEGAPHLHPDHLPVFDCANKCGAHSVRFISPEGHLKMMAAVQPFLSGSISKTVNMPSDATIEDVANTYMSAWKMGIKSIALYRDGSKFSQPLATSLSMLDGLGDLGDTEEEPAPATVAQVAETLATSVVQRVKLPSRRSGYTQSATIGGQKLYLRTGEYEDGRLGEIFLDTYREGAAFRSMLNAFAIAVSIGLQYGVPLDEFCDAFIFTKFEPNGIVRGHDAVKTATSIIDFIFRDLAISYLDRQDLAHVKVEDMEPQATRRRPISRSLNFGAASSVSDVDVPAPVAPKARSAQDIARDQGFTGEPCPTCGHLTLVRNGTCNKCQTCGSTTGCS